MHASPGVVDRTHLQDEIHLPGTESIHVLSFSRCGSMECVRVMTWTIPPPSSPYSYIIQDPVLVYHCYKNDD